jgi:hypothetical protein
MEQNSDSDKSAAIDNTSHDLDMVALYRSQGTNARMHADMIHGILESNGVYSIVSGLCIHRSHVK